jgi:hypothetical protein
MTEQVIVLMICGLMFLVGTAVGGMVLLAVTRKTP